MKNWRLIDTGSNSGRWNMDFDLKMLLAAEKNEIPPALRFYRWNPPAVSLGAAQKPAEEINLDFCRSAGIDVVHRPSGGGAIFHHDELTYSFVGRNEDFPTFRELLSSYYTIIEGLKKGLAKLGINADIRGGGASGPERYFPCFALSSRHDLVVSGKKLVGSAQRRKKNAFLQHGSLPFSYDPEMVARVFRNPETFFDKATCLSEILGRRPDENDVKQSLKKGLEETLSVKFVFSTI